MPENKKIPNTSLVKFNEALLKLNKSNFVDRGSITEALHFITEVAAESLNIDRASIWLYNEDQSAIICSDLFEKSKQLHSSGVELFKKDFPKYFEYLQEERTLPASNAHTDPATFEFSEVYLKPLGINSMLDAPIRINGIVMGVVCNEHIGDFHTWTVEEQTFAGAIADYVGRAYESFERFEALQKIKEQQIQITQSAKFAALGEMAGGIAHEI
ncbi:MAG: GAF domain-containing protein, partial [Bdellovibrionales bacterium]|nr:GAF domain-containing protein [Bdellovibrionales bacterium]